MTETPESLAPKLVTSLPKGTLLFREGDDGTEMFVVQAGAIRVSRQQGGVERTIAVLGPGEFVGEMAVLTGERRTATAVVEEDAKVVVVDAAMLESLVRKRSEVAVRLLKRLAFRLKAANDLNRVLLQRDPQVRTVMGLCLMAEERGLTRDDGAILVETEAEELAGLLGLGVDEVRGVLDRLYRGGNVERDPAFGMVVRDTVKLREFAEFLATRETQGDI